MPSWIAAKIINYLLPGKQRYIIIIITLCSISYLCFIHYFHDVSNKQIGKESLVDSKDCWLPLKTQENTERLKTKFLRERKLAKGTKIVLLYTGLFFHSWWWRNTEDDMHFYTQRKNCQIKKCFFTYEKTLFFLADAVVFHAVDLNKPNCLREVSKLRPASQKWIVFIHESPVFTFDLRPYNGLFNWTMTYMQKSDIFLPYFKNEELIKNDKRPIYGFNFAAGKSGKAVWVVSHCGLPRDSYALELEKHIGLAVFGDCGVKFSRNMGRCSDWGTQCEDEIRKFKFYLAFENCFCEDYITEKYWEKGLKYGLLPVVMGAFGPRSHVIPGSYIDVNDYDNIESLARHLLYLDANDTAYNEYFKWRYKYKIIRGGDCFCKICEAIQAVNKKEHKVYHDLDEFWSVQKNCDPYDWRMKNIKSQISKSKFRMHPA